MDLGSSRRVKEARAVDGGMLTIHLNRPTATPSTNTYTMWLSRITLVFVATIIPLSYAMAQTERTPAPEGAEAYIISPEDGAVLTSPVTVQFGLRGMGVAPAGTDVAKTGHHHLLVDVDELPDMDKPIPSDEHHLHFGGGQTEVKIELKPGKHTLQLILGDRFHIPHDPPVVSKKITVTVQ